MVIQLEMNPYGSNPRCLENTLATPSIHFFTHIGNPNNGRRHDDIQQDSNQALQDQLSFTRARIFELELAIKTNILGRQW